MYFFFFKQKTAYEMRISDWSSDVCSSDLKFQAQAGTAYTIEAGTVGSFTPRVDWTYASKTYNDEINSELLATPAGSYFNGSLTWRSEDKQIGRTHVCTPVPNALLVCRLMLEKKKHTSTPHPTPRHDTQQTTYQS